MKQLKCEMCGSPDLIKQDGLFVCQNCGTKYSLEEARKMMIEGTVDVSGSTVNISNTKRIDNLYQVARRFRDENNASNAEKYYSLILEEDPNSWEASFYVVYFRALACKIAEIRSAAISIQNCLNSVLGLILSFTPHEEQVNAVNEIVFRCKYISNFLFKGAKNHFYSIDKDIRNQYQDEYSERMEASRDIMYLCGDYIDYGFSNKNNDVARIADIAWQEGIVLHNQYILEIKSIFGFFANPWENEELAKIETYNKKIGKFDRSAKLKKEIENLQKQKKDININYSGEWKMFAFLVFALAVLLIIIDISANKSLSGYTFAGVTFNVIVGIALLVSDRNENQKTEQNKIQVSYLDEEINKKRRELDSLK